MTPETCEVPIMLDLEGLTYEDIAKLDPLYEEYKTFWDDPRDISASENSLCIDGLSDSSSLPSMASNFEFPSSSPSFPSPSMDVAMSPSFRAGPSIPRSQNDTFHSGGQYRPTFDKQHDLELSQVAIFDDEECFRRPLSTLRECIEDHDSGTGIDPVLGNVRISRKQLFGVGGWLGSSATLEAPLPKEPKYKSLIGLGKKFKQQMEGIAVEAVDMVKAHPLPFYGPCHAKVLPTPAIATSLDATVQAKLYMEMEVMICVCANRFLMEEYACGRISKESIRKVNNFWGSKNRPEVVEFQYDQATQRQLILSNIRTLHFSGESSTNPVTLHSNLHNWKAAVKEMSVRTFCAPDSAVRKHMHDIQKLLDMLGAPIATFLAFEELQMRTLCFMKEQRAKNYLVEGGRSMSSRSMSSRVSYSRVSYSTH